MLSYSTIGILLLTIIVSCVIIINHKKSANYKNKYQCSKLKTLTYKEFKSEYRENDYCATDIPKVVFRTAPYQLCSAPYIIRHYLEKTLKENPGYIQVYFDDKDCEDFIQEYYPQYWPYYDVLIPAAYKADLWRLLVIYKYGGIYNDIGHIYYRPISLLVEDTDELVLTIDNNNAPDSTSNIVFHDRPAIHNAFFAAYRKHKFLKYVIDCLISNIHYKFYGNNSLDITGPGLWGACFVKYFKVPKLDGGVHDYEGHKVKLVKFYVYKFNNTRNYIGDINGIPAIQSKFKKYYDIIYYSRNIPHYSEYWMQRKVYKH
jgi:mannosyltransferase OCH1-like enzyme